MVLFEIRTGDIDDVYQEIGHDDFLERRFERVHEVVREPANEAHRIGDEQLLVAPEYKLTRRRIEGRKQLVGGEDLRAGQRVEQGGLARVGVADDGAGGNRHALAFASLDVALLDDVLELLFQVRNPVAHDAAILLELGFAFAAQRTFSALTRQVRPCPCESRQRIFHARERDL